MADSCRQKTLNAKAEKLSLLMANILNTLVDQTKTNPQENGRKNFKVNRTILVVKHQ